MDGTCPKTISPRTNQTQAVNNNRSGNEETTREESMQVFYKIQKKFDNLMGNQNTLTFLFF